MFGVRRLVDRNGSTTNWNYDLRDRLIRETWTVVGGLIYYTYDSADRLTGINDTRPNGPDFTFTYDTRGQLQNERQFHPLMNRSVAFDRDYDAVGNQTRLAANIGGALASITHDKGEIAAGQMWAGTSAVPASLGTSNMDLAG